MQSYGIKVFPVIVVQPVSFVRSLARIRRGQSAPGDTGVAVDGLSRHFFNTFVVFTRPVDPFIIDPIAHACPIYGGNGRGVRCAFLKLRQSMRAGKIPFEILASDPNAETLEAIEESMRIAYDPNEKGFTNIDELFESLNNDAN